MVDGGLATPAPKSLELVLSYNYTTLTSPKADIWGGRLNDVSATVNYYINKYMISGSAMPTRIAGTQTSVRKSTSALSWLACR